MIIAGFPCIGKSTMAKKYDNVLDLSSTKFHYLIDEESLTESLKGREKSVLQKNPQWPQNYIDEILKVKDDFKIVFVLARDYILQRLNELNINYFVALPQEGQKEEYLKRASIRGNAEEFLKIFDERYEEWRTLLLSQPVEKIYLKQGEYIEDALKRNELIK